MIRKQNLELAKLLGMLVRIPDEEYQQTYKEWDKGCDANWCLTPPSRWRLVGVQSVPEFDRDLNACQMAWRKLDDHQKFRFRTVLAAIVGRGKTEADDCWYEGATPQQWVEALFDVLIIAPEVAA